MILAPSLLSADLARLADAATLCAEADIELLHFDVMDGHFVPNLTYGPPVLAALRRTTDIPIDVHLMVERPDALLDDYLEAGADWISVHWEACTHLDRVVDRIRQGKARAGVALNPATPIDVLEPILPALDFVLLMSVNPGFGGQAFLPYVLEKARGLRAQIQRRGLDVTIEIDGGIGSATIRDAVEAGVDVCVAGSAIFGKPSPKDAIAHLRQLAGQA